MLSFLGTTGPVAEKEIQVIFLFNFGGLLTNPLKNPNELMKEGCHANVPMGLPDDVTE